MAFGMSCDDCEIIEKLQKENEELKKKNEKILNTNNELVINGQNQRSEIFKLKEQIEKIKSETKTVYLAFVYVNDCLDDVLSFGTLEKAEEYKKSKDSFHPCCVVNVNIEQHYLR